jgi:heterodisulfide reductase subunit A
MLEAGRHPNIQIMSYCDITEVSGYIGNFVVKIKQKPRYVDEDLCTNCGLCRDKCPVSYPNQFDMGFSPRKAIDIPFPQAVPTVYSIDMNTCVKCYYCVSVCNVHCIDFSQQPKEYTVKVGTIIIATGWDIYEPKNSFGYGIYENVLNQLQLERILAPNGPTQGHLVRPSDGKRPKRILTVNCAGSRDVCANAFCPGVCCLVSIKNAKLIISEYPDTEVIISAIDIRAPGKDYEEYYRRAREFGISFIKGMVGNIEEDPLTKNLIVTLENSQTGEIKELEVDMVILSTAPVASKGTNEIAQVMKLEKSADGYLKEYHARLNPIDTKTFGIYIAGMAQGPKAIDASVNQGRGAASSASIPMHAGKFEIELIRAIPDTERCSLCGECIAACPFKALKIENNTLIVDEIACRGCGACAATCKSKSITLRYFRDNAFESYIDALLAPLEE